MWKRNFCDIAREALVRAVDANPSDVTSWALLYQCKPGRLVANYERDVSDAFGYILRNRVLDDGSKSVGSRNLDVLGRSIVMSGTHFG